jgi:DHA2 family multidrug resistance protein
MARDASLPRSAAGPHSPWLIAVIVSIATFMEVLDTTIANVALRHIAGSLAASEDEATYILTSYLVSNAIVLTISGWLANVIGRKRYYMMSVALFTVSSVMCAMSTSLTMMIICRVLQGIGGGGLAPVEQSIFADSFPPEKRAMAFSIYGFTVVTAPAIGPAIGGLLTDTYSWHWVFLINLPIGLLSLALTGIFITDSPAVKKEREKLVAKGVNIDWIGFILVSLGFGCLQIVLDRFERDDGFESSFIDILSIVSIVSLISMVVRELTIDQPIVNLRLLKVRAFAISCIVMFMFGFIIQSTTQLIPQMTQQLLAYDATHAGLTLTLGGIATVVAMPIVGFITGRYVQPRYLVALALTGVALAMLFASGIDLDINLHTAGMVRALQAVWMPFIFIPISAVQYVGVPPGHNNEASAITNLMRNLGGSFGVSVVTTELQWGMQKHQVYLGAHITPYSGFPLSMSMKAIGAAIQQQATILSYLDVFRLLGGIAICTMPLALFLPNIKKGSGGGH